MPSLSAWADVVPFLRFGEKSRHHVKHTSDDTDNEYDGPSKSSLKRDSARMQVLGEKLMALKDFHWEKVPMSDALHYALVESRRITSHEGLRRHKQYIGRLMREEDSEAIQAYISKLEDHRELNTRAFHALEDLREQLINGGNEVVGEVIGRFPAVDSPKLRQLVRNAKKERDENVGGDKHGTEHGRKLFRYLRELEEGGGD